MQAEVCQRVDKRLEASRAELASLDCRPEERDRIELLLNQGDLSAADELIALSRAHLALPPAEDADHPFLRFFPQALRDIDRQFSEETQNIRTVLDNVDNGISFPGVDMSAVTDKAQRRDSRETLALWFRLKRLGDHRTGRGTAPEAEDIRRVLKWLGFDAAVERTPTRGDRVWFDLTAAAPVRSPVPAWGSLAAARYRLLCAWGRPTDDQLLLWAGTESKDIPCLVFYFGRMLEQVRRDMSRRAREKATGILVMDDSLMLFLCGTPGVRLPALFACTLPFTFSNPYTPYAAGNVPSEMFVGRADELRELLDQHGSCFVYGGRQLGKSALLRTAQRTFHDPSRGNHAIYIDAASGFLMGTPNIL